MPRRSATSNTRAATRAVAGLRRREALDEIGELLASLLLTTAELVDKSAQPDSDVAAYARAGVARAHLLVIAELRAAIVGEGDEGWLQLLLAASGAGPVGGGP